MDSVVRTFLLVSAAYLLGGVAPPEPDDERGEIDQRSVEELRQASGDPLEDVSPLAAAFRSGRDPMAGSG